MVEGLLSELGYLTDAVLKRREARAIGGEKCRDDQCCRYILQPALIGVDLIGCSVYYTGGAQHPPKQIKFDFYYMHCVNCSIFFSAFLKQPWISQQNQVRLLEWKGRLDLCMYASRRSPEPLMGEITNYKPKEPTKDGHNPWVRIFERAKEHDDDGHAAKLVRALANGEQVSRPYEDMDSFRIKGDMWSQLGHMGKRQMLSPKP